MGLPCLARQAHNQDSDQRRHGSPTLYSNLSQSWRRRIFLCCLGLCLPLHSHAESTQQQLNQVQSQIGELRQDLAQDRQQHSHLQTELKSLEQNISELRRKLRELNTERSRHQQQQKDLDRQVLNLNTKLTQLKQQLAQHLRTSYSTGQHQALKLLLNQDNPAELGRTLTYYRYLTEAQLNTVAATEQTRAELGQAADKLQHTQQQLQTVEDEVRQQQQALQAQRNERKQVISQLNADIKDKDQQLAKLQADEKHLLQLMEEIRRRPGRYIPDGVSLGKLQGKLAWPAKGKISHRFGSPRLQGKRKWQGVMIDAKLGSDVNSIAAGKVVFADWIRGYGLMLIVDHGHDYMSVYAHNESLYKKTGDLVAAGEIIASVGNSGGQHDDGLYFELRHKGSPIDPAKWCR